MLGTSKVKREQQEINSFKAENQSQRQEMVKLNQTINRERQENEKTTGEIKMELNKIYEWLPDTKSLVRTGDYCKSVGFPDDMVKELMNMRPVYFSGELYSNEFHQRFKAYNSEARLERDAKRLGSFNLLIDKIDIIQWFRLKYRRLQEKLGINIPKKRNGKAKVLNAKYHLNCRYLLYLSAV